LEGERCILFQRIKIKDFPVGLLEQPLVKKEQTGQNYSNKGLTKVLVYKA
jgi:hypothetical protein